MYFRQQRFTFQRNPSSISSRYNKMDPRTLIRLGEKGGKCGRKKPPIEALI
jgi:hypothetical protein